VQVMRKKGIRFAAVAALLLTLYAVAGFVLAPRLLRSDEDHSRPTAFVARLEPINFELQDFTTGADGGRFTFAGYSTWRKPQLPISRFGRGIRISTGSRCRHSI